MKTRRQRKPYLPIPMTDAEIKRVTFVFLCVGGDVPQPYERVGFWVDDAGHVHVDYIR